MTDSAAAGGPMLSTITLPAERPKTKDVWDKVDVTGKLLGSILIPFGIALAGYLVNSVLHDRSAKEKTNEIAINVLQSKDQSTPELRQWALDVFQAMLKEAGQTLSTEATDEVKKNSLPSGSPAVAPLQFIGKRYSPQEFRDYVAGVDFSNWNPDKIVVSSTATK